jgi:hypothetical protein
VCACGCACLGGRLRRYRGPTSVCVGVRVLVVAWIQGANKCVRGCACLRRACCALGLSKPHHPLKVGAYTFQIFSILFKVFCS